MQRVSERNPISVQHQNSIPNSSYSQSYHPYSHTQSYYLPQSNSITQQSNLPSYYTNSTQQQNYVHNQRPIYVEQQHIQ